MGAHYFKYLRAQLLKKLKWIMEPQEKRLCSAKIIGTHNGHFHCDEALACYMLRILPEYKDAKIVRTRDQGELDKCDIVVDVGGVFDPAKHRYDHHQKTFDGTMHSLSGGEKPWVTKLSSAGLVYFHFGRRIISALADTASDSEVTETLFDKVYENFVEEVDAIDNGIATSDGPLRYKITTNVSHRVSYLNPSWNSAEQNQDEMFMKAMELVGSEFVDRVMATKNIWLPARDLVKEAINKRFSVHESGVIIHLETPCPWKEHLFELEKTLEVGSPIKFVLYIDQNSKYRVQTVPIDSQSFTSRLGLLEVWRGLRDEELTQLSGISGCVFVHASGFIGGNDTLKGALEMAVKTLEAASERNGTD